MNFNANLKFECEIDRLVCMQGVIKLRNIYNQWNGQANRVSDTLTICLESWEYYNLRYNLMPP